MARQARLRSGRYRIRISRMRMMRKTSIRWLFDRGVFPGARLGGLVVQVYAMGNGRFEVLLVLSIPLLIQLFFHGMKFILKQKEILYCTKLHLGTNINAERVTRANPPATNPHQQHEPNQQSPQTRPSNNPARHHPHTHKTCSHHSTRPCVISTRECLTCLTSSPPALLTSPRRANQKCAQARFPAPSIPSLLPARARLPAMLGLGVQKWCLRLGGRGERKSTCCFVSIYAQSFVTIHETLSL